MSGFINIGSQATLPVSGFICIIRRESYKEVFTLPYFKFKVQPKSEERNVLFCLW